MREKAEEKSEGGREIRRRREEAAVLRQASGKVRSAERLFRIYVRRVPQGATRDDRGTRRRKGNRTLGDSVFKPPSLLFPRRRGRNVAVMKSSNRRMKGKEMRKGDRREGGKG